MKRTIIALTMTGAMVGLGVASAQAHTVAPGETLSSIAAKHGTTWQTLAKINKITNPDKIMPGQHVKTPEKPKTKKSTKIASPVPGHKVTHPFGLKDAGYAAGYHTGDDYAAATGTPVVAVSNGTVVKADGAGGAYGNWIQVKGKNGHVYMYAHLSKISVKPGQHVKGGQKLGAVGTTGNSTGPHLHFEMSKGPYWSYASVAKPTW